MKISDKSIIGLVYSKSGNKADYRWCDKVPGFGVRIYPSGKTAFVVSYRLEKRKRIQVIADTREMSAREARRQAKLFLQAQETRQNSQATIFLQRDLLNNQRHGATREQDLTKKHKKQIREFQKFLIDLYPPESFNCTS